MDGYKLKTVINGGSSEKSVGELRLG